MFGNFRDAAVRTHASAIDNDIQSAEFITVSSINASSALSYPASPGRTAPYNQAFRSWLRFLFWNLLPKFRRPLPLLSEHDNKCLSNQAASWGEQNVS
jgi:hypothetical protein